MISSQIWEWSVALSSGYPLLIDSLTNPRLTIVVSVQWCEPVHVASAGEQTPHEQG